MKNDNGNNFTTATYGKGVQSLLLPGPSKLWESTNLLNDTKQFSCILS